MQRLFSWNKWNLETPQLHRVKSDLVLCYKMIFYIVYLNTHDFLIYLLPLPGAINLKYSNVLAVALSDRIPFVKELLTFRIGLPVGSTDFGSLRRFRNSLDARDVTILVDAWSIYVLAPREYFILV